ncbi:MAG: carboxymuconolactone decarboxylase family protein [Acidobacteria bacterium]|nr:carboxymuconolactone decarboxylase family protein [Acidobacteriota bacterium]MBI3473297.1 carboxymuconolactone decarboxylase family protein [Candidatus Solibacter usitatus]
MAAAITLVEPAQNEFLAQLESRSGKPNHFFRTMAHRPEVLKNFVPLYGAIMGPGSVARRLKELVYLAASFTNQCAYCSASHRASGKKAGIAEEEMAALMAGQDERFLGEEAAVIRYSRELTRHAAASREGLEAWFNQEQIVELTLVAAMANFTNRFNNGLGLQPE